MSNLGIGQLAKRAGVAIDTVRYYERNQLLAPAGRLASGYRRYGDAELKRLRFIRRAKALGFTLEDIRSLLSLSEERNVAKVKRAAEGKLADVERTIQFGIRSAHPNARTSVMPRFGVDGILGRGQIGDVTEFVLGLGNRATDPAAASRGQKVFAENCVSCHGDKGVGQRDLGAPNLVDGIWLYGGDRASLVKTIAEGRGGVMPAWVDRLDPAVIKMLTIYVHTLGGGE